MDTADIIRITPSARLACFGAASTPARVELLCRPLSWRVTRALLAGAIGVGLAPVAAILPPHLPWAGAALLGAGLVARGRWLEHYTLRRVAGACPRCGAAIEEAPQRRLRAEQGVTCGACGESLLLEIDLPQRA